MSSYKIIAAGPSRSFPEGDPFLSGASEDGEVTIMLSGAMPPAEGRAVAVELDVECLGVHTGEALGVEGSATVGFARYRNGDDPPSQLVELVRQPKTSPDAIAAVRAVFEGAGLTVVVSSDRVGRIVDRLVRPKYNAALRFLDEGLASAADMDLTCKMGLGYPDGPLERVERGGLARHYDLCRALFEVSGAPGDAPARRAVVAARRRSEPGE